MAVVLQRGRSGGFGVLDAMLTLGLVAIAAVISFAVWGNIRSTDRAEATLEQFGAIRNAVKSLLGDPVSNGSTISTALIARTGLVPGTVSPTSILNPYGGVVTISGNGTGSAGYSVNMGTVPVNACIKLLTQVLDDPELTGLEITSGLGAIGYGGSVPPISSAAVTNYCGGSGSGTAQVSLTLQHPGSQTVLLGGLANPNAPSAPVGHVIIESVENTPPGGGSNPVLTAVSCTSAVASAAYCASHPYVQIETTSNAADANPPSITASAATSANGQTTTTLTTNNLASALTVTAAADPNYNIAGYNNDPNYTGDPPPEVSAVYDGTVSLSSQPGNVITGVDYSSFAAASIPDGNAGTTQTYMSVTGTDQNGQRVYNSIIEWNNGVMVPANMTDVWLTANGTATTSVPPANLTTLNLSYSISSYATNDQNNPAGVTAGFSGNPQIQVTTTPVH